MNQPNRFAPSLDSTLSGARTGDMPHYRETHCLDLTPAMAAAYLDARLAARRLLREDRQRAARKGVETKRKAH